MPLGYTSDAFGVARWMTDSLLSGGRALVPSTLERREGVRNGARGQDRGACPKVCVSGLWLCFGLGLFF